MYLLWEALLISLVVSPHTVHAATALEVEREVGTSTSSSRIGKGVFQRGRHSADTIGVLRPVSGLRNYGIHVCGQNQTHRRCYERASGPPVSEAAWNFLFLVESGLAVCMFRPGSPW